jgi:hypothetical protein
VRKTATRANEAERYFERGGPPYRLPKRVALCWGVTFSLAHSIVGLLAITWILLLLLALTEGRTLGSTPKARDNKFTGKIGKVTTELGN